MAYIPELESIVKLSEEALEKKPKHDELPEAYGELRALLRIAKDIMVEEIKLRSKS